MVDKDHMAWLESEKKRSENSRAYKQGYDAAMHRIPQRENPYKLTRKRNVRGYAVSQAHWDWISGHQAGLKDRRAKS